MEIDRTMAVKSAAEMPSMNAKTNGISAPTETATAIPSILNKIPSINVEQKQKGAEKAIKDGGKSEPETLLSKSKEIPPKFVGKKDSSEVGSSAAEQKWSQVIFCMFTIQFIYSEILFDTFSPSQIFALTLTNSSFLFFFENIS